jgi:hypothetical protein
MSIELQEYYHIVKSSKHILTDLDQLVSNFLNSYDDSYEDSVLLDDSLDIFIQDMNDRISNHYPDTVYAEYVLYLLTRKR